MATVQRRHRARPVSSRPWRGVVLNGGEFGAGANISTGTGGTFSNENPGTYGSAYQYDGQTTLNFLAGRGVRYGRVMFRWERLQPTLSAALDSTEASRIDSFLSRCATAGIKGILTPSSYGAYWVEEGGGVGVRRAIGSAEVPQAAFVDFWTRFSQRYKGNPAVAAYSLSSEPVDMANAAAWESAAQAAVTAIRANSDNTHILVPTYNFSSMTVLSTEHPSGPWITDPYNNFAYDCHQYPGTYFGDVEGGSYSYASANAAAISAGHASLQAFELTARAAAFHTWLNGARGFVGEVGWPNQDVRPTDYHLWDIVGAALLDYYNARGWGWLMWGTGEFWGTTYIYLMYSASVGSVDTLESSAPHMESRL
jgi:endoglucanase